MNTTKSLKVISLILILTMLGNMILLPGAAQARPQALPSAVASVVNGGERFMTAAPEALGQALELAQLLDYIEQTRLENLTEPILVQARERALATAQQAATAQGSVGAIANGLTELDYEVQAAANVAAEVANLDTAGFGADLETALQDAGLTPAQITSLETAAVNNFTVRGSDLPTATVAALQDAGLTSTEIDQVEQALADYGLADDTLPDRLAQFQTSQQELSIVRTQALVAYLQLLTKQVFVRQAAGETGRDMSAAEVEDLVKDQLRLLIHLGYLDSLGGGSNPNVGEGQWLFIERYSLRVAERLDELILETHNVGLVVDLLVALQIHGMALAALAGDAAYAKTEVEPLADFLETLLGDNLPGGQAARETEPPFWWTTALALRTSNPALLSGYEPALEPAAVAVAQSQAQGRIKGLASPLWLPLAQGTVAETDETNNTTQTLFHTTAPVLPPGVLDILNQVLGGATPLEFLWEVLTGQTENGWAIGGNIILSFVPVAGEILDLIALFSEPTLWGKAMALIGLVASILSDGTEILAAVGIAVPPALVALPAAIGAEAVDVGAAILRNVDNLVSGATYELIKRIPFAEALQIGGEILSHLARRAVEAVEGASNWPGSLEGVVDLIQSVLEGVWGPFVALLTHYGDDLGKLFRMGFGEGGFLAGRVLRLSDETATYSDEVVESIVRVGDDLGETAAALSDEATVGLGRLTHDMGETNTRRFLEAVPCPSGVTYTPYSRPRGLASPLLETPAEECLNNALAWFVSAASDEAKFGFYKLVEALKFPDAAQIFDQKYENATRLKILETLGTRWDDFAKLPGRVEVGKLLDLFAEFEADDILKMIKNTDGDSGGVDVFARLLNSGKYTTDVLIHLKNVHLIPNTHSYGGLTFKFHSNFKLGTDEASIAELKQMAEIQLAIWDAFKNRIRRSELGFENAQWNCGLCAHYAQEFLTNSKIKLIGRKDVIKNDLLDYVCVDKIVVGAYHVVFYDKINDTIWDPATNTWGEHARKYFNRVKYLPVPIGDPEPITCP